MQPITKAEQTFMEENNIIKIIRGQHIGLITGSKLKHGKGKPSWVEEPLYNQMLKLMSEQKQKVDATS